jgi:hypothetical protein
VAAHWLWDDPVEQPPQKVAHVIGRVANPAGMRVNQLLIEAEEVLAPIRTAQLHMARLRFPALRSRPI